LNTAAFGHRKNIWKSTYLSGFWAGSVNRLRQRELAQNLSLRFFYGTISNFGPRKRPIPHSVSDPVAIPTE
jgi:hypothetical protein